MNQSNTPFKNGRIINVNLTIDGKIEQKEYHCAKDDPVDIPLSLLGHKMNASSLSAYENGKPVAMMDFTPSKHAIYPPYTAPPLQ